MTRVMYRLTRTACPAADRPWLDALFAESEAIESGRARLVWLLGIAGLLCDRYCRLLAIVITPVTIVCLAAVLVFSWLAIVEFEGILPEDDWYGPIATLFAAVLIGVSVLNLRRRTRSLLS